MQSNILNSSKKVKFVQCQVCLNRYPEDSIKPLMKLNKHGVCGNCIKNYETLKRNGVPDQDDMNAGNFVEEDYHPLDFDEPEQ